ncbi:LysR family transcriptional regulator [Photobacterium sanguinicancri]|uniref:LysR family transcriptional regulator n=1 Tax=Photobacterium sanguinicancri TaxID=875932 RepID=UPI003D0D0769
MYSEEQLMVFTKVVEKGSISQVALDLNRSQSAISIAIRNLEETIGYRVFERLGKRLQLNPQGEQLYQLCQRRIMALGRLTDIAENLHQAIESEITMYIDCEVDPIPIATLLEKFHRCFPYTQVVMQHTWQSASFFIVPEDFVIDENNSHSCHLPLYSEEVFVPISGAIADECTPYIEVPWGPKSPMKYHLMTAKPTAALQMILANMGWCWIPHYLLADYRIGSDYKSVANIEPITRRYVAGSVQDKGPALQWLVDQTLKSEQGINYDAK